VGEILIFYIATANLLVQVHGHVSRSDSKRNHSIKIDSSSFERAEEFRYLGTILKNLNSMQEKIMSRLESGNDCSESVQKFWLSKNIKNTIYKTIILYVFYVCETWLLTLREENRLRVFENRVLRSIFGSKRDEAKRE
jgi:hypothetical protein